MYFLAEHTSHEFHGSQDLCVWAHCNQLILHKKQQTFPVNIYFRTTNQEIAWKLNMDGTYNIVPPDFAQTQRNNYANLPLQTGSRHNHHMVQRMKPLYTNGICSDLSPRLQIWPTKKQQQVLYNKKHTSSVIMSPTLVVFDDRPWTMIFLR